MDHPAALHRLRVGVPATIEHASDSSGGTDSAKAVAETTQARFIINLSLYGYVSLT